MIIELILVEGVSDVQLISYYLQNVYGWKHEKSNTPGIASLDEHEANKATVGTFFSVRNPQNAMRSFGTFISKIDWSKSESLNELFLPFMYLGEEKPNEIVSAE